MNRIRSITQPLVLLAMTLGLTSCRTMPPTRDDALTDYTPERFTVNTGDVEQTSDWWETFESEQLNRLMGGFFAGNLTFEQMAARLEQAEAVARKSGADSRLKLNVQAEAASRRTSTEEGESSTENYSLGLYASYEVDLWGRVRAVRQAAGAEREASRFDFETSLMTLSAEMAQTYFDWLAQNEVLSHYKSQLNSARNKLDALELRYKTGQSTSLAVLQQRQQVAGAEAKLPPVRASIQNLEHALAILSGKPTGTDLSLIPEPLPQIPARPNAGLPVNVLENRPDVQAARMALETADWNTEAAQAARLPAITLTGSLTTGGENINKLFDDWASNLAAGLLGPLLDGGSRKAELDRTLAVSRERLAAYRLSALTAIKEAEDALSNEQHQTLYVDAIERQLAAARRTEAESMRRYQRGILPYVDTLTAITSREGLEITRVQAQAELLSNRIQLYRALGGDWTTVLEDNKR